MGNKDKRREARDAEIGKLRKAIRRLESDKRKLISELTTLTTAFDKNIQFLRGVTKDLTVEELIQAARKELTLKQTKDQKEHTIDDMTKKWACHKCDTGVLKIIVFTNLEGTQYLRCCSNKKCGNRTKPKPWDETVTGIR